MLSPPNITMKTLVLGGIRSGKSRFAESMAKESGAAVIYIATATANDPEMQARIDLHQSTRPDNWILIEEQVHLASVLPTNSRTDQFIIVDCLTLWLTNLLMTGDEQLLRQEINAFLNAVKNTSINLAIVSNETNMGVVPLGELSRKFCDEAGRLHQQLATECSQVILMVAGLPLTVKDTGVEQQSTKRALL